MKNLASVRILSLLVLFSILLFPLTGNAEIRRLTTPIAIGAAVTSAVTASIVLPNPMMVFQMEVTIPATDNNRTFTVSITDDSDRVIKTYTGLADDTGTSPHILKPGVIVQNGYKLSVTASGATGNAITITAVVSYAD